MVHDLHPSDEKDDDFRCVHCHSTVGHGERMGMGRYEPTQIQEENEK